MPRYINQKVSPENPARHPLLLSKITDGFSTKQPNISITYLARAWPSSVYQAELDGIASPCHLHGKRGTWSLGRVVANFSSMTIRRWVSLVTGRGHSWAEHSEEPRRHVFTILPLAQWILVLGRAKALLIALSYTALAAKVLWSGRWRQPRTGFKRCISLSRPA